MPPRPFAPHIVTSRSVTPRNVMLRSLAPSFALLSASLLAACASPASSLNTEAAPTLVVFNSPPEVSHFDLGDSDRTHGELISWHADLDLSEGEEATRIGHCNGTMQVTRLGAREDGREHRMTNIELDWDDSDDSLLVAGSHPYKHGVIETDVLIVRAVIGGTGRFAAAGGQMVSEKLPSGWYRHSIWLAN